MEIKRMRQELIKKCLRRFSIWMVMEKDTVLIKVDTEKCNEIGVDDCCTKKDDTELVQSTQTQATELEMDYYIDDDEENALFTHISIPHAGYDLNGIHASSLTMCTKKQSDQSKVKKHCGVICNPWRKKKKEETTDPRPQSTAVLQLNEKRTATKFCAICLTSYERYDKISWSSNEGCTHTFHHDCILTWLLTLGEKWSRNQRFTENLDPDELLRYSLECPCCRQDFVSRAVICAYCDEDVEDQALSVDQPPPVSEHSV